MSFCVPDHTIGNDSHHANENGAVNFFFVRTWIKPISRSQECYVSVSCWGQTDGAGKERVYGRFLWWWNENKTQKSVHTLDFFIFFNMGTGKLKAKNYDC